VSTPRPPEDGHSTPILITSERHHEHAATATLGRDRRQPELTTAHLSGQSVYDAGVLCHLQSPAFLSKICSLSDPMVGSEPLHIASAAVLLPRRYYSTPVKLTNQSKDVV
jgi:hypothetical protein